jgi:hypothetical protein
VAGEDGFGGECGAVAVFVAAHVCSQGGFEMFSKLRIRTREKSMGGF